MMFKKYMFDQVILQSRVLQEHELKRLYLGDCAQDINKTIEDVFDLGRDMEHGAGFVKIVEDFAKLARAIEEINCTGASFEEEYDAIVDSIIEELPIAD
jgi:hypothetical protein